MNLIEDLHKIEKSLNNLNKLIILRGKSKTDTRSFKKCIDKVNSMLITLDSTQNLLTDAKYRLSEYINL
jgi:hypothetical protein